MKRFKLGVVMGLAALILAACDTGPTAQRGFRLPDGDAATGRNVFLQLECNACHMVADIKLAEESQRGPVAVVLGGPVANVKTYSQLVTSIINPSHRLIKTMPADQVSQDGKSLMKVYNEMMTVQQLVDLVAFLQPEYEVTLPEYSYYSYRY
jgi:mono/diheme cytochrome c family protein